MYVITIVGPSGLAWDFGRKFETEEEAEELVPNVEDDNPGCLVVVQSTEGP